MTGSYSIPGQTIAMPSKAVGIPSQAVGIPIEFAVIPSEVKNLDRHPEPHKQPGTSLTLMMALPGKSSAQGFSYVEVLVASMLVAVTLAPAINALQTGILSTGIHQSS